MCGTELRRSGRETTQQRGIRTHLTAKMGGRNPTCRDRMVNPTFPGGRLSHHRPAYPSVDRGNQNSGVVPLLCRMPQSLHTALLPLLSPPQLRAGSCKSESDLRESHSRNSTALANSTAAHALSHSSWPPFLCEFV